MIESDPQTPFGDTSYIALRQKALDALSADEQHLDAEQLILAQKLDELRARRQMIASERAALEQTQLLFERIVAAPLPSVPPHDELTTALSAMTLGADPQSKERRPPRARIGAQRYRVLHTLRTLGPTERLMLAELTGFDRRRVSDVVSSDIGLGFMSEEEGIITLTAAGTDLLERFENSRRSRGIPLPSLVGPIKEEDEQEEADEPTHTQEAQTDDAI